MKKDKMIKNTCGAISLMLALLVVPFYAVAGILVEASRYQSALTGLDDAMNTSALSVLSDYDSFLQSRFGLLAMAQNDDPSVDNGYTGNKDLEEAFQKYLNAQDTTDTRSFRTTSAAAAGVYPLADTDILKAQVLDYSTLTLPTVLVSEFGSTGLQDIIKEVQNSIPGLKFLKVGSSIADTATKTLDVTKKLEKAKDSVKSLNEKTTSYDSAHSAFDDALNELKKTMGEKPGENATVDELDAYNKRYEQTLENAQKAKKEYEKKLQAEIKSTESLNKDLKDVAKTQDEVLDGWVSVGKDAVNAVGDAKNTKVDTSGEETTVTTLTGQIDATKKELEKKDITAEEKTKLEQQLKQLQQQEADLKTISNAADATVKAADSSQANKILKDYNTDSCSTAISGLTEELNRVKDMDLSDLTLPTVRTDTNNLAFHKCIRSFFHFRLLYQFGNHRIDLSHKFTRLHFATFDLQQFCFPIGGHFRGLDFFGHHRNKGFALVGRQQYLGFLGALALQKTLLHQFFDGGGSRCRGADALTFYALRHTVCTGGFHRV